jgi:hypothetical protein
MARHLLGQVVRVASPSKSSGAFGGGALLAFAGVALLVVLLGALVIGIGGRGSGDAENGSRPSTTSTSTTSGSTTRGVAPSRSVVRDATEGPEVRLDAIDRDTFGAGVPVVAKLPHESVLRVSAIGYDPYAPGAVEQCTLNSCTNSFPVTFDETGAARFQYLVRDAITTAGGAVSTCRAHEPPCVVHLRTETDTAFLTTVFGDLAATPRQVTVTPSARDLVEEAAVTVTAQGFPPGHRVHAKLCVAPDTAGTARCGSPSPVAPFTIGADGTGRTALVIRGANVGSDGAACGRDAPCGVVVQEESSAVPAPVVPVTFTAGATAHYDSVRLAIGVALAFMLLAVSFFLVHRTDWRKPTEADTPDLDRAVLSDF